MRMERDDFELNLLYTTMMSAVVVVFPSPFVKGRNELSGRKTNKEGRGRVGSISRRCLALIFREMKGRRRQARQGR